MKIGIGLPAAVPGVETTLITGWARSAEARGFDALGVIDRVVYDNHEPLMTLAAAAVVTERIELLTDVLIAPIRATALLAKQAATLDRLSGGRLTLRLGLGGRVEDFTAVGMLTDGRGRRFDQQLRDLRELWSGNRIGPAPARPGGPPLIAAGYAPRAIDRAARLADSWCARRRPHRGVRRNAALLHDRGRATVPVPAGRHRHLALARPTTRAPAPGARSATELRGVPAGLRVTASQLSCKQRGPDLARRAGRATVGPRLFGSALPTGRRRHRPARDRPDGCSSTPARVRLRSPDGRWLLLHATALRDMQGEPGSVAVVIEPARGEEIAPTFLSPHTVRDHVKAVFEKVGVSTRGELTAKLFAEHYAPPLKATARHVDGELDTT